ncbi:hypothetical protein SAY87_023727 [Trapa incisa]|uniref:Pentatricopeptide repeat-containing protein n=1 Tax=Trapa incisa TaxID=236973 RepID=A0AAN7KZ28_9MYRT|nr:hypothetical protein SAY87_023727 [Trapa incisa]
MARAHSSMSILRYGSSALVRLTAPLRFLSTDPGGDDGKFQSKPIWDNYQEIAKRVCDITRTRARWEQTLVTEFPSCDFSNPLFLHEFFKHQSNLLISIRFLYWSLSYYGASPDPDSCKFLFDALLKAKAGNAAKSFVARTGFTPQAGSLEQYVTCLFEGGLVGDAMEQFRLLKESGFSPRAKTWSIALSGCVKARRSDLVFVLYSDLVASGGVSDMGEEVTAHLIRAFCLNGNVPRGYKLLRLVLEDGLVPRKAAFDKLIATYCEIRNFNRVSELLHIMIEKKCAPNISTYHAVINGLLKNREGDEALRVFNELKDRGYCPDIVMYSTMITRFCKIGWVGEARKFWFEMISKGFLPDEYTICTMIQALFKIRNVKDANKIFDEMSGKGLGLSTMIYNTMICGLILNKKIEEAWKMFQEMPHKGIARDFISYRALIWRFGTMGKIRKGKSLLREAIEQGLVSPSSDHATFVGMLRKMGGVKGSKVPVDCVENEGLNPWPLDELIVKGLCKKGFAAEAKDWLVNMLKCGLTPRDKTFRTLLQCLAQGNSMNNSFVVLGFMLKVGCPEGVRSLLIPNFREGQLGLVET